MSTRSKWILFVAVVLAGGCFLRLWRLNERPMHTDESVHAVKFGKLLEHGDYTYDPHEFHGPTLNYATLISAALRGEKNFSAVTETTLRLVPAAFGIALLLTPLLFLKALSPRAVFFGCVLLAFSPAFVYYSRYYIQETLLVFFTAVFIGCGWRYVQTHKVAWLVSAGICLGLMHATKETFVFSLLAAAAALAVCGIQGRPFRKIPLVHLLAGLLAAVLVSVLFYSSFAANRQGIFDSVTTYLTWVKRAGGHSVHIHPWTFYLDRLVWVEFVEPLSWNEDGIVALAVFGMFLAFIPSRSLTQNTVLIRFFAVYTMILTLIYSAIPYKTPWCVLSFLYGMVILAGVAADRLFRIAEGRWGKAVIGLLIAVFIVVSPIVQSWMLNFRYAAAPSNPWVYAHTTPEIESLVNAVEQAASASPQGRKMPIQVIAAGDDYWPLPWYLRDYPNVGYWSSVTPAAAQAPLILARAEHESQLLDMLYTAPEPGERHLYMPLFEQTLFLRPGVPWHGYLRKDLADRIPTSDIPPTPPVQSVPATGINPPDSRPIENRLKFSHEAMNTVFEVYIQDARGTYAGRAARAAFNEVDRLEKLLSRFIANSDISRINHSSAGEAVIVDEAVMECLLIARKAYELTEGAFDITVSNEPAGPTNTSAGMKRLDINPDTFAVKKTADAVTVDLGGIGKGYAVDAIARVLTDWGISRALIHGGASSVRAMDPPTAQPGWPVTISNPADGKVMLRMELANEVLSSSGLQKGAHIVDPSTGQPVSKQAACWVRLSESAALADALSTAGMIMPSGRIRYLSEPLPDLSLMLMISARDAEAAECLKVGGRFD